MMRHLRLPLLAGLLLLAACATAPAGGPADRDAAAALWNGFEVRSHGYGKEAELRFYRAGALVHRERDETAHRWEFAEPRDLDGDGVADLHTWFWSGGAHCCITHLVWRGGSGALSSPGAAWRLEQGHGDAAAFVALEGYPRPVMAVPDSSSAYLVGSFVDTSVFPYFVEAAAEGLRLAAPLMRSARPGEGPAALSQGPTPWTAFLRRRADGGESELADLPPPAARIAEIRRLFDARPAAPGGARSEEYRGTADIVPLAERHIKAHCVYDETCDIAALAAELEQGRRGMLGAFPAELEESWRKSELYRLKHRP